MVGIFNNDEIIDGHVHITPPKIIKNLDKYRRRNAYFNSLCSSPVDDNVTGEEVIEYITNSELDRAIVFGFAFRNMELCRLVNDYTIKMVQKYPEKLIGFAVVNPRASGVKAELERCQEAGLQGVGELLATGQNFDLKNVDHLSSVASFCRRNNWPLLVHLNEPIGHDYQGKTDDSLEEGMALAQNFPEVSFIFAHLGGGLCFYELMPEVRKTLKNVYYDTAALPFLYNDCVYDTLQTVDVLNKVILATDYPLLKVKKYWPALEKSDLEQDEIKKICGQNLVRLLEIGND